MKVLKRFIPQVILVVLVSYGFAQDDSLRVSTQQGDVVGTFSTPSVRQFVGIPFATAKRWQAPTLPPKRKEVFDASAFSDSCFQMLTPANIEFVLLSRTFGRQDEIFVPESEDCLSVNIWSPGVERKQNTAVMIWIPGGLDWGTGRLPIYNATNLVRDNDDVIVVTINYRLNIFGFPNAPQLDTAGKTQNFGFLDVEAAIHWVHDNIANFGGDPNRITLFGQSAGAVVIDAYALSHPNDTIIKGMSVAWLIEQSGSTFVSLEISAPDFKTNMPRINTTTWNTIAATVGCGAAPTKEQFTCMQNVPGRTLEDSVIQVNIAFESAQDEITYFSDPLTRIAAGNFLNVPLLAGTTRNEDDVFTVANEIAAFGKAIPVLEEIIADIDTILVFTCPISAALAAYAKSGVEVFRYEYQPVFPNLSLRPDLRAFQGSEIPIIFGTYDQSPIIAPTPTEVTFAKFLQSAWVRFARDPKQGLIDLGWPKYNPNTASLIQLGNSANVTGAIFTKPDSLDILCPNKTFLAGALAGFSALQALSAN